MTAKEVALQQRQEAKKLLNRMLNIPEGFSSIDAERFVDCIIGAAILETAVIQQEAMQKEEHNLLFALKKLLGTG